MGLKKKPRKSKAIQQAQAPDKGAFFSPENARTAHYKKPDNQHIINTLDECYGNVTFAAEKLGVSRRVMYDWFDEYPELKDAVKKTRVSAADFVTSKLFELIEGVTVEGKPGKSGIAPIYKKSPNVLAIMFYLKCQAGWSDKAEPEEDEESLELLRQIAAATKRAKEKYGSD